MHRISLSQQIALAFAFAVVPCLWETTASADDAAAARRQSLRHSYGTYSGEVRTADGHMDCDRLITELGELHANTYNWLSRGNTSQKDLRTFLPLAKKNGVRVWVTLLPPSESVPKSKAATAPGGTDYEKWAAELAELSVREPALVAWSIDDFAYNLKTFTPEQMRKIIAAQREKNPKFAFVPCVYFNQAKAAFVKQYSEFFDGILFPYRSDSATSGFKDSASVVAEVKTLKERFGEDFQIIVDVYATRHSRLGVSTPEYVEQVMMAAYPVADGVHIYCHQNKLDPQQRLKYDVIRRVMSSWDKRHDTNSSSR